MPGLVIKGGFPNLQDVTDSLDAVEVGLGRLVPQVAKEQLGPIIAEVKEHLPFDPTHRGWRGYNKETWKAPRDPGHIRASVVGGSQANGITVRSTHPGGPVHWWGGTIAPSGSAITITPQAGAGREFESKTANKVSADVESALDRLCRQHGL